MNALIFLISLFIFSSAQAADYVCPSNFNYVSTGMSVSKVIELCGQPDKKISKEKTTPKQVKQWVYDPGNGSSVMTVNFSNSRVVTIIVNKQSVMQTNYCRNPIKIGESITNVARYCGYPKITNQAEINTEPVKQTQLKYQSQGYLSSIVFTFENDQLTGKQTSSEAN